MLTVYLLVEEQRFHLQNSSRVERFNPIITHYNSINITYTDDMNSMYGIWHIYIYFILNLNIYYITDIQKHVYLRGHIML